MRRRLAGSVLIFEAIVIILAIPVAINVSGVDPAPAIIGGVGLAVAAILVAARVDRPGGVAAGWIVQALVLASAIIIPMMALLGAIFAALWYGALRLAAAAGQEGFGAAPGAPAAPPAPDAPGTAASDEREETS
jgi:hypothetical protein